MFFARVIRALDFNYIPYALIGRYAEFAYGSPVMATEIEIAIPHLRRCFEETTEALKSVRLVSGLPVDAATVFEFRSEYVSQRGLTAWPFYNPGSPLERVEVSLLHDERSLQTKLVDRNGENVWIADREDLIEMRRRDSNPASPGQAAYLSRMLNAEPDPWDRVPFLENLRRLNSEPHPRQDLRTSIRLPSGLVSAFKYKAKLRGVRYQSQIKVLMREWLESEEEDKK